MCSKIPDLSKRIEELTVALTETLSIVNTPGEIDVVDKVYSIMQSVPYFAEHPEDLRFVDGWRDTMGRKSVMAIVRGRKDPENKKTVVGIGHIDTVGVSDYRALEPYAAHPYELTRRMAEIKDTLSAECRADIESGSYLFGRGIFDMKGGVAVLLALAEYLAADPDSFAGNLVVVAVCDEEGGSAGMLGAVSELRALQEQGMELCAVLDTDYMTAEYEGDENKYVYIGTVGKLLPAFFVVGKETHVGEPFKGLDPNQIASAITTLVNLNHAYSDIVEGEVAPPPVVLQQKSLKKEYSVQIARTALVYFNYATHSSTPDRVLEKMLDAAETAMRQTIETLQKRYDDFRTSSGHSIEKLPWKTRVITFEQLCRAVRAERGAEFDGELAAFCAQIDREADLEQQQKAQAIVEYVHGLWNDHDPVVVVCFFPPYYPHVYVEGTRRKEYSLLRAARKAVEETECDYKLVWKKFFPYISDLSYAAAPRDPEILAVLGDNMPGFGTTYSLPIDDMRALDLPVIDIGVFGKDAHKFTERLETGYSFNVTPELVLRTVRELLEPSEAE